MTKPEIEKLAKEVIGNMCSPQGHYTQDELEIAIFKAGAEWALREAIEICNSLVKESFLYEKRTDKNIPGDLELVLNAYNASLYIKKEIEQLLRTEEK